MLSVAKPAEASAAAAAPGAARGKCRHGCLEILPPAWGSAPLGTSCGSPSSGCDPSDSWILVTVPPFQDQPFSSLITGLAGKAEKS